MNTSKIKSNTLSVFQIDSKSILCGVEVNGNYCNISLRFDQGNEATLCGYSQNWAVHDENIEYYNYDSPTFEECENEGIGEFDREVYISRKIESKIFQQLKKQLKKQFDSKEWTKIPKKRQNEVFKKIDKAIELLKERQI